MQKPSDFFKLLQGEWGVNRTITSYNKLIGTAIGIANITKLNDSTLLYREELDTKIKNIKTKSYKQYLYVLEEGKLFKKFAEDNTLFYQLIFKNNSATGEHLCGSDVYKASYIIHSNDKFSLSYFIKGLKKDDVISTQYSR